MNESEIPVPYRPEKAGGHRKNAFSKSEPGGADQCVEAYGDSAVSPVDATGFFLLIVAQEALFHKRNNERKE
ncbi:hypothetical protein [Allofournierella massiliensis]|uniref:hypothetical protein n=1 Tax=Allofournierella massiliensis TaxID=1650663 RepID=UPI0039A33213